MGFTRLSVLKSSRCYFYFFWILASVLIGYMRRKVIPTSAYYLSTRTRKIYTASRKQTSMLESFLHKSPFSSTIPVKCSSANKKHLESFLPFTAMKRWEREMKRDKRNEREKRVVPTAPLKPPTTPPQDSATTGIVPLPPPPLLLLPLPPPAKKM